MTNTKQNASLSRRQFGLGFGTVAGGLTIGFRFADAQTAPPSAVAPPAPQLPAMIRANPALNAWVRIAPDGAVTVCTGRVELGQGCLTVMKQIAAEELDVEMARITLVSGDTAQTPDEGVTAGSLAVKLGGAALGHACADARGTLMKAAADSWSVAPTSLTVQDGTIIGADNKRMGYGEAATKVSLIRPVDASAKRKAPADQKIIGTSVPRVDIPAKVFGTQVFIHDLRPSGMLFGSIARPPAYAARLVSVDLAPIKRMPGVVEVVRDGSFLGVIARREEQAQAAATKLAATAAWSKPAPLFDGADVFDHLRAAPKEVKTIHEVKGTSPVPTTTYTAEYKRAFQAHASIGASCALALWTGDKVDVWSHAQGPFPLRDHLASGLRMAKDKVRVIHAQGSGCYGHNGADDVALDAALLARAVPGKTVRVHWAHEEEMAWEPWGSAMIVKLAAAVDADGKVDGWSHDLWSFPHNTRPGTPDGCNLRAAWYLENPVPISKSPDLPLPNGGAARNAPPIYAAANQRVTTHYVEAMQIRTSALRTLGGFFNAVAAEMFMDELAAKAGRDPVAFRLANLKDERFVAVLNKAVAMSGWTPAPTRLNKPIATSMSGFGVGLSRYKNQDCYVAVIAEAVVDTRTGAVKVPRMWTATDSGRVVNPDGLRNQIDGGAIQATSWALMEAGRFDAGIMQTVDYASYPIIDFIDVPSIESAIIDRPAMPSLGAGEGSQAPAGAAVANAIYAAIGRRVADVPFTRDKVLAALRA
jgi:nicotinate dehydrogenase subunit B